MRKISTSKLYFVSAKERKFLSASIVTSLIAAVLISGRTMQQHPDSMISGGLRWLSEGPFTFQYNTYGPFSYFIYGVVSIIYFAIGFVLGFWHSPSEFEMAYRVNSLNIGNLKFSSFYIALNIMLLIQSLNLLIKSSRNSSRRKEIVLALLMFAPIITFQFTLETIEPLVFFGISLTVYTFSNAHKLISCPKRLLFLATLSWMFTFGVRLSTLPIVLFYSLASAIRLKNNEKKTSLYITYTFAALVSFTTYSPVFYDRQNLEYVVSLNRSLAGSSAKLPLISENLEIFRLNLGFWGPLLIGALFLSVGMWKRLSILEHTRIALIFCYTILYLINHNGHPKYLIPLIPLLVSLFIDCEIPKFKLYSFLASPRVQSGFVFTIFLIGIFQGTQTISNFISITNFDSRLELKKFLLMVPEWRSDILVTDNVLAEITRGPDPSDYNSLRKEILLDDRNQICSGLLILSSTSYSREKAFERLIKCKKAEMPSFLVTISPFASNNVPQGKKHWSALLSLGTPEDVNRLGYGPIYWIGIYRDLSGTSFEGDLCSKNKGCKFSRL